MIGRYKNADGARDLKSLLLRGFDLHPKPSIGPIYGIQTSRKLPCPIASQAPCTNLTSSTPLYAKFNPVDGFYCFPLLLVAQLLVLIRTLRGCWKRGAAKSHTGTMFSVCTCTSCRQGSAEKLMLSTFAHARAQAHSREKA